MIKDLLMLDIRNKTVIIPMNAWLKYYPTISQIHLIGKTVNPLSCIFYMLTNGTSVNPKDIFGDREVLFLGDTSFMKINFSKMNKKDSQLFLRNIRTILNKGVVLDPEAKGRHRTNFISTSYQNGCCR